MKNNYSFLSQRCPHSSRRYKCETIIDSMRQVATKNFGDTEVGPLIKPEERLLGEGYLWWVIRSFQSQLNRWKGGGEKSFLWEEACVFSPGQSHTQPLAIELLYWQKGHHGVEPLDPKLLATTDWTSNRKLAQGQPLLWPQWPYPGLMQKYQLVQTYLLVQNCSWEPWKEKGS